MFWISLAVVAAIFFIAGAKNGACKNPEVTDKKQGLRNRAAFVAYVLLAGVCSYYGLLSLNYSQLIDQHYLIEYIKVMNQLLAFFWSGCAFARWKALAVHEVQTNATSRGCKVG